MYTRILVFFIIDEHHTLEYSQPHTTYSPMITRVNAKKKNCGNSSYQSMLCAGFVDRNSACTAHTHSHTHQALQHYKEGIFILHASFMIPYRLSRYCTSVYRETTVLHNANRIEWPDIITNSHHKPGAACTRTHNKNLCNLQAPNSHFEGLNESRYYIGMKYMNLYHVKGFRDQQQQKTAPIWDGKKMTADRFSIHRKISVENVENVLLIFDTF